MRSSPSRTSSGRTEGRLSGGLLLVAAALATGAARAESDTSRVPIGGRVFADVYVPSRNPGANALRLSTTTFWLEADPKLGERSWARVVLEAKAEEATGQVATSVREGFGAYAHQGWELRVGRQIIPWGKSDVVNPTDFLTAKDYTFLNPDDEVRRTGATSFLVGFTPLAGNSSHTVTAVWTPVAPQSELLIAPSAIPAGVTVAAAQASARTVVNSEVALKVAYLGSGWDASVSAFRGFSHMPEFDITALSLAGTTLTPVFRRVRAVGADGSLSSGDWVLRLETSYSWLERGAAGIPTSQPDHWDTVVGAERPFWDDFRMQLQFLYRFNPSHVPADQATGSSVLETQARRGVAASNALILGYQDRSRPGYSLRLSYAKEDSGVEAELFSLGNFIGGDYLLRPKLSYRFTDSLRGTVGTDHYGGPDDRPLGSLKFYNSVFVEAKYTF